MTTTTTASAKRIAILIGSTRSPRIGPTIANLMHSTLSTSSTPSPSTSTSTPAPTLELLDLSTFNLPLLNEPGIPQMITDPAHYAHAATRAWSAAVRSYDAFVFVTAQYNWSVPAALKNALDYLYHEWGGKPALVVSYGGHGGDKSAAHLKGITKNALGMRTLDEGVELSFGKFGSVRKGGAEYEGSMEQIMMEVRLDEGRAREVWSEELEGAKGLYKRIVEMLGEGEKAGV